MTLTITNYSKSLEMRLLYLGERDRGQVGLKTIVNFNHLLSPFHFPGAMVCIMGTLIQLLFGWSLLEGVPHG